jgi:hypothetical protein
MRLLKLVMYIFYKYYSKGGTRDIPYFSALMATVFLIFIHLFQLLIITDKVDLFLPTDRDELRILRYAKAALFLLPIALFVGLSVKKSDLAAANYEDSFVKKAGAYLVLYIVLSVSLLFALIVAASS